MADKYFAMNMEVAKLALAMLQEGARGEKVDVEVRLHSHEPAVVLAFEDGSSFRLDVSCDQLKDDPLADAEERRAFADSEGAFAEWQASGEDSADISDYSGGEDSIPGRLYKPGWIEARPDGRWFSIAYNDDILDGDLANVERWLWENYAKAEIAAR